MEHAKTAKFGSVNRKCVQSIDCDDPPFGVTGGCEEDDQPAAH
jgi:hypothetical protein